MKIFDRLINAAEPATDTQEKYHVVEVSFNRTGTEYKLSYFVGWFLDFAYFTNEQMKNNIAILGASENSIDPKKMNMAINALVDTAKGLANEIVEENQENLSKK